MTKWVQGLLQWFTLHRRPMPWRDDPSPYKVWISEIMLQQTRVAAVIPYFARFIHTFPDVHRLAAAVPEEVLKSWEGLGYYSRARNLHAAARMISLARKGVFPQTEQEWRALPGVGPYTAAAVASIACGKAAAAVDGNVMRVWSRMRGIADDLSAPAWRDKARQDLLRYARTCDPSLFNQALMELGALVCLPRNPACNDCPLARNCIAARTGRTHDIPARKRKKPLPHRTEAVLVLVAQGTYLLQQRPPEGLLAGFWEFPVCTVADQEAPEEAATALARALGFVVHASDLECAGRVEHAFTHFSQTLQIFLLAVPRACAPSMDPARPWLWCNEQRLQELPLSRSQRRIHERLVSEHPLS